MVKVWLNHWFSTARSIIELIKDNNPEVHITGSNENNYSVIKSVCDDWHQEPVLKDEKYVEYCLDFCVNHNIDVFLPRRGMLKISEHKSEFERVGTKVMIDDYKIVSVLNQKTSAYDYFRKQNIAPVPDYYLVKTVQEFVDAYEKLHSKYEWICFKFVRDEGGKSFRLIDNNRKGYAALFKKQNTRMTLEDVLDALSEREVFAPIIIMPFLPDDEISVDCLDTNHGLIALPRVKSYAKYETLRYDQEILDLCKRFQKKARLSCPYNIQFKYLNGTPYFLEVNTRMSGGIHMACYASGVNIPQIGLKKLLGINMEWVNKYETKKIAQILKPVTLE